MRLSEVPSVAALGRPSLLSFAANAVEGADVSFPTVDGDGMGSADLPSISYDDLVTVLQQVLVPSFAEIYYNASLLPALFPSSFSNVLSCGKLMMIYRPRQLTRQKAP